MRDLLAFLALSALVGCAGDSPNDKDDSAAGTLDIDVDGYTAAEGDCDDGDSRVYPGAEELCDGLDQDCDGDIDEGATGGAEWHPDADGDGFGDAGTSATACTQPDGYVADASDCDDADDSIRPDAPEICDGVDQDCDGTADNDPIDETTWYTDNDGDGFGDDALTTLACDAPAGTVAFGSDCDDTDETVSPAGVELCDDLDQDCDGEADEGAVDAQTWFPDADGDGAGDASISETTCDGPEGWLTSAGDCDDTDPRVQAGGIEVCGGGDEDCDGTTDEDDASDASTFYADADGDGFGNAASTYDACSAPAGYVANATDCDDTDGAAFPGGTEVCGGADEDCDGATDEPDAEGTSSFYADADDDGYGDGGRATTACDASPGWVADDTDCDDADVDTHPGGYEVCGGADEDCDGAVDESDAVDTVRWYADADGDGYGDAGSTVSACDAPAGYVSDTRDCDDADETAFPGGTEVCGGGDEDCDGGVDEDAADVTTWYADTDGDGFGDPSDSTTACDAPAGYVADGSDCDDSDPAVQECAPVELRSSTPGLFTRSSFADIDGDGKRDVALADGAGAVWLARVPEAGSHALLDVAIAATPFDAAEWQGAADATGDGIADLAWIEADHAGTDGAWDSLLTVSVARGPLADTVAADLSFSWFTPGEARPGTALAAIGGDLDGDAVGDVFVATGGSAPALWLLPATASGALGQADVTYVGPSVTASPAAAYLPGDLDGDGIDDVILTGEGRATALLGPLLADTAPDIGTWTDAPAFTAHGDLDGDGYVDLVATTGAAAYVVRYPFAGALRDEAWMTVSAGDTASVLDSALGDTDGDGRLDLVVSYAVAGAGTVADGGVFVLHAPTAGTHLGAQADTQLAAPVAGSLFGVSVDILDDRHGDGADDVIIGSGLGSAWIYPGL